MATYNLFRNIQFTSTTADYDLFATDTGVRTALMSLLGLTTTAELDAILVNGIRGLNFQIFISGSTVKIDGEEYQLIDDSVYDTGDFIRKQIKSVQITETGITGVISLNAI